jgi:hypothetical protein
MARQSEGELLPPEISKAVEPVISVLTPDRLEQLPEQAKNKLIRAMFGCLGALKVEDIEKAFKDREFIEKLQEIQESKSREDSEYIKKDHKTLAQGSLASAIKASDVAGTMISRAKGEQRDSDMLENGFGRLKNYLKAGDYGNFLYHFAEQTMRFMKYNEVPQKVYEGIKRVCVFCKAAGIAILSGLEISAKAISSVLGFEGKKIDRLRNAFVSGVAETLQGVSASLATGKPSILAIEGLKKFDPQGVGIRK